MNPLPFKKLSPCKPRKFVPAKVDWGDWKQIEPLYDQLESRAHKVTKVPELEQWLLDWSELSAALDQDGSERHIAMTCHTDDRAIEKAYLHVVERIQPRAKPREFRL